MHCLIPALLIGFLYVSDQPVQWNIAEENGKKTQIGVKFCTRFVEGWLKYADPETGLIPRNLRTDAHWNAKDSAADNYPFMVLTCRITGNSVLNKVMEEMLRRERALTARLDSLPDDFLFKTHAFRVSSFTTDDLIFGAAEYAKDGLIPITEWMGPSPWLDRMEEMIRDIWKYAAYDSQAGKLPTRNVEVAGDLLQAMSRLYWLTAKEEYREWTFRLADQYLIYDNIPQWERLQLDDHGCEIIGGLAEAYLIASKTDPQRFEIYRPKIGAVIDRIRAVGRNEDGLFYNVINGRTGQVLNEELTDNWGYNYNAFLTVAEINGVDQFRNAVYQALSNINKYIDYKWEGGSADGYADSIEGCINLLNRIPNGDASSWVDHSIDLLLAKQRYDGIIEGWHGDGNSARTVLMWVLMKTQGVSCSPWREDIRLGAVRGSKGDIAIQLDCEWPWCGVICFDRPRHKEYLHMPYDYPRLNQFPEWFTAERELKYRVEIEGGSVSEVEGAALWSYQAEAQPGKPLRMAVSPL